MIFSKAEDTFRMGIVARDFVGAADCHARSFRGHLDRDFQESNMTNITLETTEDIDLRNVQ